MIEPREIFHFTPPIHIKGDWILGLTDLEVNYSILHITKENNKFELNTDTLTNFHLKVNR